jgi:hypothetical protein
LPAACVLRRNAWTASSTRPGRPRPPRRAPPSSRDRCSSMSRSRDS